jgi:hypothetical protein
MSRTARWQASAIADGVWEVDLASWKYFYDYVRQEMLDFSYYIWRGQRDAEWKLESSLDRVLRTKTQKASLARAHLTKFKQSVRGRRGPNPAKLEEENEWWALGQHHGLETPLLDWTESPFAALYFAFVKPTRPPGGKRSIWALGPVFGKNKEIVDAHKAKTPPSSTPAPILEIVRPQQDENARLVAQSGLFTRVPLGRTVEDWVRTNFSGETGEATLLKLSIPELGRTECLRTLNRMNINHLSLFPDTPSLCQHPAPPT